MGLFDKLIESVSDVINDVVEDVSNGDVVGVIVEVATAPLGLSGMGDIAQDQIEIIVDAGVDYVEGNEVSLEYDPDVISAIADAGIEDAGTALEIYTGMG